MAGHRLVVKKFLDPVFEEAAISNVHPSNGDEYKGMVVGGTLSILGIALAYLIWVARPGMSAALQRRFAGLHRFLENKWYFDELIDALVVRPALGIGRWANSTFERYVVQGVLRE